MIHTGVFEPAFPVDVNNDEIAAAVGQDIKAIVERKDRALATETLSKGMEKLVPELYKQGKFDGIISFGGSGGTSLVTPAMRALPIGVLKVIVSTMATVNVSQYVGTSDIFMMPSIVDVTGLNKISKMIFSNAVLAIVGKVNLRDSIKIDKSESKPLIAASMFGATTPCVDCAKDYLEKRGYEVLVFHATGTGGKIMGALINAGFFAGVLDLTTTEWADQVVGGVLAAGEARCGAAIDKKIPQIVSVGACDMVNFGPIDTVPKEFSGRNFYKHNPTVTLMRTYIAENKKNCRKARVEMEQGSSAYDFAPAEKSASMIDADGQPFDGVEERKILFDTLKKNINNELVEIRELDNKRRRLTEINNLQKTPLQAKILIAELTKACETFFCTALEF